MRKAFFTIFLLAVAAIGANAQKVEFSTALYRTGDDASWSSPKLDESEWQEVSIKGNDQWGAIKEENSYAWYRVHFSIDQKIKKDEMVLIHFGYTDDKDEAFLNGKSIGGTTSYNRPSVYAVKGSDLLKGDNVLAVRVRNNGGTGGVIEVKTKWRPSGKFLEVVTDPAQYIVDLMHDVPSDKIDINEVAHYTRYADADKALGEPAEEENRVVFMGNSITDRWYATRPQFFNDNALIGRGISGETSAQFLLRFQNDVTSLKPAVIVINYGTNDIAENTGAYNEDQTFRNVMAMCEMARGIGAKVVLASTLPHGGFLWNTAIKDAMPKVCSLNARVKDYAQQEGFTYVDYFSAMVSPDGSRMREDLSSDGVHPNDKGYEIMEGMILPVVTELRK